MPSLLSPMQLGPLELPNRVVMAPTSRARSGSERAPTDLVARYYVQRAGAGLIVSEASSVSPMSVSRPGTSALFTPAQVAGWRHVAECVHAAGGRVFQQLYHLGRKSDHTRMPDGAPPLAASAIACTGKLVGGDGPVTSPSLGRWRRMKSQASWQNSVKPFAMPKSPVWTAWKSTPPMAT